MESSELVFQKGDLCKAMVVADVTFYVGETNELRNGFLAALDTVLPIVAPHGRWYRTENMTRSKKVTSKVLESVKDWFSARFPDREEYGLTLLSAESSEGVGPWSLSFRIEPPLLKFKSGYFQCSFPLTTLNEAEKFVAIVTSLADALPFRSGHAGYGVVYDEGDMSPAREAQIRAWHNRFPGLDARDLAISGGAFRSGIKGPSWLTLLDPAFVASLGGLGKIRKALPREATVTEGRHGVMIQAGTRPTLGDRNRQEDVSVLRAVNKVLRPIRIKDDIIMRPFRDADGTREWLERLDRL